MEVFIDGGAVTYSMVRKADAGNSEGFRFWGNDITVTSLEVARVHGIWP